jgi:ribosome maturation factor RimP
VRDIADALIEDRLGRIRGIAERVARSYGLELFDLQFRRETGGWVLRLVIDRVPLGPDAPEEPVSLADCERVSQDVSAILDVEDVLGDEVFDHPYTLEVSSPGLDRPLRHAADYRRFTGRLARIVVGEAIEGRTHFQGRLRGVEGDVVIVEEGRRRWRIPLAAVRRAHLEVEF